jgi:hypothetical protein
MGISSTAQKFPIPQQLQPENLQPDMRTLARQVLSNLPRSSDINFYDDVFRIQLSAGLYREALASLDSLVQKVKATNYRGSEAIGIHYRAYALARLSQPLADGQLFASFYSDTLAALYHRLPPEAKTVVQPVRTDTAAMRIKVGELLRQQHEKDSIDLDQAQALLIAWNTYYVMPQIITATNSFLSAEEEKSYIIQDSLLIPGADGATLSAIVYRKRDKNTPLPAVLVYSIYASARDKVMAREAAEKGFAGVVVNTRGKHLSPQDPAPFEHDAKDAYHVLDWISKQPWCNGKIGMYGGSYLGFSQWSAAKKMHPALKTIVPQVAVGIGIDYPAHNGIFMSYMLRWIHYVTNNKLTDFDEFGDEKKWDSLYVR